MFCEKCGKKLEDGVKFCPSCGKRIEIPENQTDTVHEQPEKSKKSRKKSKLPLVLIAVLAIILIVGGILYGTVGLNLQKDKLAVKIKKAGIPQYTEEMNEIVDEWDDFGIFSISDKRNDLHKLKKIVNYLDEYNTAVDEYKSMNKEKEQYALDEDSYKEYENALHDCSDAIEQKNPESLINAVEIAKETLKDLKKADDSYVDDRVKMYEGLDLKDAGDDVVSGYKKNLKEIQDYADPSILSWGTEESIKAFLDGNAAICETWPTLGLVQAADDESQSKVAGKWALSTIPYDKTGTTLLSAWDVSIPAASKNQELAWEWVKMYTSAEKQDQFYDDFGILSPRKAFWERDGIKGTYMDTVREALDTANIWWRIPASTEVDSMLNTVVSQYMTGEIDLETAVSKMKKGIEEALKNAPPEEGTKNYNM